MFKILALAAVAIAAPVNATTNITNNSINKAANIVDHTGKRAVQIEMEASKKVFKAVSKYAKLAVLQGQYSDYQFVKQAFWKAKMTMRLLGPSRNCKADVFARCVAQASANKTRFDGNEFDFMLAQKHYPQCTTKSNCAATLNKYNAK